MEAHGYSLQQRVAAVEEGMSDVMGEVADCDHRILLLESEIANYAKYHRGLYDELKKGFKLFKKETLLEQRNFER